MSSQSTRRDFLKTAAAAAATTPFWFSTRRAEALNFSSPNERPVIGCIGTGSRWGGVGPAALNFGDCVAVCDVDATHAGRAQKRVQDIQGRRGVSNEVAIYEDYRTIIDNDQVDIVTIVTPDHWHTKIAIEAMKAGKDVYCEKPLTLTVEESKQIVEVLNDTKRIFQVGTQQRTEMGRRFLTAVALIQEGRIGDVVEVECRIGGSTDSGPIPVAPVPDGLNWEKWLGQTQVVEYRQQGKKTRCHYEFRWWYEYSGGKLTDWGAHHVDIAQWAIGQNGPGQGPTKVESIMAKHPMEFVDGNPTLDDRYNAATAFMVHCHFPNNVLMKIRHDEQNGILFTGTKGRFFVGRGSLAGSPVDALKDNPLPEDALKNAYKGKDPAGSHMANFMQCVRDREEPISDVWSHVRALNTCHLANIAIRLNRTLEWDAQSETITNDSRAREMLGREQRKGYEIEV